MLRNKHFLACRSGGNHSPAPYLVLLSHQSLQLPRQVEALLIREDFLFLTTLFPATHFWDVGSDGNRGYSGYRLYSSFSTLISMNEFKSGQDVLWGWSKDGETGPFSLLPPSSSWKLGL